MFNQVSLISSFIYAGFITYNQIYFGRFYKHTGKENLESWRKMFHSVGPAITGVQLLAIVSSLVYKFWENKEDKHFILNGMLLGVLNIIYSLVVMMPTYKY